MKHRLDKTTLLDTLSIWNRYLKRKVRIIACGGTALTLLDIKESTKDVDFLIPETKEYTYLVKTIIELGYERITGTGWQKTKDSSSTYILEKLFSRLSSWSRP